MITKSEAADALHDVDRVQRRTIAAGAYGRASPQLIFAGLVWTLGYVATGLTPPAQWSVIWLPLTAIGILGSFVLVARSRRADRGAPAARAVEASRGLWLSGAAMAFMVTSYLLFRPVDPLPYLVFPALLMALIYVVIGAMGLTRLVWIGAGIYAVTVTGLLLAPATIAFWVALAGGGGLILGGWWLRKA